MLVLHGLEVWVPPPAHLPDLYAALFSIFGAANLCYIYAHCVRRMYHFTANSPSDRDNQQNKQTQRVVKATKAD